MSGVEKDEALRKVAAARRKYDRARPNLHAAILAALNTGAPIGEVADASGYDRMHVRRIRDGQQD